VSTLAMVLGAAVALPEPPALLNDLAVALPGLDGARGLAIAYERFLPDRELSLGVTVQARETAIGDYGGLRLGAGVEVRHYKHDHMAWLAQPDGAMVGWFAGARADVAIDATHDRVAGRWLSPTLETSLLGVAGYRFAIWRGLDITPSVAVGVRHDHDLSGRVPAWTRPEVGGGLTLGWLF